MSTDTEHTDREQHPFSLALGELTHSTCAKLGDTERA